jgi:hypothetical protein
MLVDLELHQLVGITILAPALAPVVDKLASSKLELLEIRTAFVK